MFSSGAHGRPNRFPKKSMCHGLGGHTRRDQQIVSEAATQLYAPDANWSAASVGYFIQSVLQAHSSSPKQTRPGGSLAHLQWYLGFLFGLPRNDARGKAMSKPAIAAIAQAEARLIGNPNHVPTAMNGPAISGPIASPSPISVCAATIAVWLRCRNKGRLRDPPPCEPARAG